MSKEDEKYFGITIGAVNIRRQEHDIEDETIYDPPIFEPGSLVTLDKDLFNGSGDSIGLVVKVHSLTKQHIHYVLVGGKVYPCTRRCLAAKIDELDTIKDKHKE